MRQDASQSRPARGYAGVVVLLVGFTLLFMAVCNWYLLPALAADAQAAPARQHALASAHARIALCVILSLLTLLVGLILIVRARRLVFPPNRLPRKPTKYVDAWAESARRMETPPEDE